jgi:hypothetical protein
MARRIVAIAVPAPVVKVEESCPFVHAKPGVRARCEACRRPFTAAEIVEFKLACNGADRCALGRHVARVCESCGAKEGRS